MNQNPNHYTWILTPEYTDQIDLDNFYSLSCYDDDCLISTFFRDEILDFLEDKDIKNYIYTLNEKFQYKLSFETNQIDLIINDLINFTTGRFKTTSIYLKNSDDLKPKWKKIWYKGKYYNQI